MTTHTKGIALVEIVVVVAMIGLTIFSLYELVVVSRAAQARELRRIQAVSLAQEGLEAVRIIRDQSWSANLASLSVGTNYYATLSGSSWTLTTTNPGPIDGLYNRTIVFANVNRDANDNISTVGSEDDDTRQVTASVTWVERGNNRTVSLATYITNFLDN